MFFSTSNWTVVSKVLRLTTKKTSRRKISGLLWGDCDWIAVTKTSQPVASYTKFWIQMDIYKTYLFITVFNNTDMMVLKCITSHWSPQTTRNSLQLLFLDSTKVSSKLSIIGLLWGESKGNLLSHPSLGWLCFQFVSAAASASAAATMTFASRVKTVSARP